MANPFESMYANWLKTITSQQSSAPQQWQKAAADLWQMPSAYWQTVGSIMGIRAQSIAKSMEKTPQHIQALASCKSWPEFVGKATSLQGEMLSNFINLDLTTNTFRASLWKEWQNLAGRNNAWQQSTGTSGTTTAPSQPKAQPQAAAKAPSASTSTYTQQPGTFIPGPKPEATAKQQPVAKTSTPAPAAKSFITPKASQPEYQSKENAGQRQPIFNQNPPRPLVAPQPKPVLAQAKQPQPTAKQTTSQAEMPLLTGTDSIPHGTVSSTANSVMRSSSGSTLASVAARRSVVARRQSRRRSPR